VHCDENKKTLTQIKKIWYSHCVQRKHYILYVKRSEMYMAVESQRVWLRLHCFLLLCKGKKGFVKLFRFA
jgi:hypothetical protein